MRSACAIGCLLAAVSLSARAQAEPQWVRARGLGEAEIGRLAAQLGSEVPAQRQAAARALSELREESLAGVAQRLTTLRPRRPDPERAKEALSALRRAAGSRRADDTLDIAAGVLPVLAERAQRTQTTLAMAEPLLLLRSLERLRSPEAGRLFASILLLDPEGVWDHELRLARERVGLPLLPALIELRSHGEARVRAFAQAGVRALGMEDPKVALALPDASLAAKVARAYAQPLEFAALPTLVRLVGADKEALREAARFAVGRFGKNAIWPLRELYAEVAGKAADKGWDAERTASELYARLDRDERARSAALLQTGMSHFVAGRLPEMKRAYDELLARDPRFAERHELAPGYAALAKHHLEHDQLAQARAAFARALWLAPQTEDHQALRAQLAFVDAELALGRGVVDLHGYAQALQLDTGHAAASAAYDGLSGKKAARQRQWKRVAAAMAVALLLALAALLLRRGTTQATG
jgi:hypothetical protein